VAANLREKLSKTRQVFRKIEDLFASGKPREDMLDELAEDLILADVGVGTTGKILDFLRGRTSKSVSRQDLEQALREELGAILKAHAARPVSLDGPTVVMMVGVNGGGKTTSAAKLAARFKRDGKRVMMAAGDTFRAAAQEQLVLWGKRLAVPVIRGSYGADPASDVLLVDTAGRIHTNTNLMNELEKIRRVIAREIAGAPQESLLVLDASIGQNAVVQAREFLKFSGLTGIFLAKLDGTARGGAVIGIADELELPIRYVGVGESQDDLLDFSPAEFVEALLP
jgi:fused signal recognition particle receptor